jgi:hypothetical protein
MSEKTRINNDQEDELNQSRFFVERGAEVVEVQEPGTEGPETEEEDILDTKSRFRESPASIDSESEVANKSPFYGQGFGNGDDNGIRREAEPDDGDDKQSLGA